MNFSKRSIKNLEGVHPDLVTVMHQAIKETPIDFTIVEGVRTVKRQKQLYAQGRTMPGMIVTYVDGVKKKSNHQLKADGYSYAVDIYPYINGKVEVCATRELELIAWHINKVAGELGIPIEWGGNWTFKDYPHFELKK
ncbi:M15 family metallopeptidase [Bacteroides sp. 519]|uniref:M15 family metallopeptidase n=1 Tax=Bacteroides sp. 519 TaxID=2302937 RepID=UPI0013D1601C|nr:M15 family metallopeptidase [Bacteroides sp. 519]NDV58057.1 M15 family peptidase [Bacteroides sp. 519]